MSTPFPYKLCATLTSGRIRREDVMELIQHLRYQQDCINRLEWRVADLEIENRRLIHENQFMIKLVDIKTNE